MNSARKHGDNAYRLVAGGDGARESHVFEFNASGPHAALMLAARHCAGERVEVFENGRSIGTITSEAKGGYWVITGRLGVERSTDSPTRLQSLKKTINQIGTNHLTA